ncbi:chemotaxis protein CheB [Dokdonella sp.]|uniref:chemotaxis protein CheB n=1 Tax=Dokdonella sp. TaxID=2291710 RepID=UPI002F4023B9
MSSSSAVAVALLYESSARTDHLRETLTALGAPIVYEAAAAALDREALARSQATVVIVNLEDEDSADLDDVYALLDDARYTVVFNDSGVSSELSGWDQARWMRHLAAKVLGEGDLDPPRPAGAEPVPLRARDEAPAATHAGPPATSVPEAPAIEAIAPVEPVATERVPEPAPPSFDPAEFIDLLRADDVPTPAIAEKALPSIDFDAPVEENIELSGIDDLLADFDVSAPEPLEESLLDEFVVEMPPEDIPAASGIRPSEAPAPAIDEPPPADFGLDFDLGEAEARAAPSAAADQAKPIAAAAMMWSLEDIDDGAAPEPVPTGRANFGIEKITAAEYLTPEGGDEATQPPIPSLSDLSLELIPIEEAVQPSAIERPEHENWLDPDQVKAKIQRVWVLGASVGGPESVREFLAEIPRDYPALFLLAQHLGDEFVDMMAKQLARVTPLTVRTPTHGERVAHGDIVIVPNSHRLQVDAMGVVVLEKATGEPAYKPSIDRVLEDVANRYGPAAGAIIFSGMSDDAVSGCVHLAGRGGTIYAQSPESCVVSTMVEGVSETGVVSFFGTPKELAEKLLAEKT